jgi:hypothetical protein
VARRPIPRGQPHRPADVGQRHRRAGRGPSPGLARSDDFQEADHQQRRRGQPGDPDRRGSRAHQGFTSAVWPESHGGARRWWGQPSGMQRGGEGLHAVDQAGTRTGAVGAGVDRDDRLNTGQLGPGQQGPARLLDGRSEVVAAGHAHHHPGRRRLDLLPGHPHRRGARAGQHRLGPGDPEHLRHQCPPVNGGSATPGRTPGAAPAPRPRPGRWPADCAARRRPARCGPGAASRIRR